MLNAARQHAHLVTQVVPSPFGLKGHDVMKELIAGGYLGELREVQVCQLQRRPGRSRLRRCPGGRTRPCPASTCSRWASSTRRCCAGCRRRSRCRPRSTPTSPRASIRQSGVRRPVGTPDSVQVLAVWRTAARATLPPQRRDAVRPDRRHSACSAATACCTTTCSPTASAAPAGSRGHAPLRADGAGRDRDPAEQGAGLDGRGRFHRRHPRGPAGRVHDFEAGVAYMEFTEAVARHRRDGRGDRLAVTGVRCRGPGMRQDFRLSARVAQSSAESSASSGASCSTRITPCFFKLCGRLRSENSCPHRRRFLPGAPPFYAARTCALGGLLIGTADHHKSLLGSCAHPGGPFGHFVDHVFRQFIAGIFAEPLQDFPTLQALRDRLEHGVAA